MRRIVLLLAVAAMMAMVVALTASPAFAKHRHNSADTREDRTEAGFVNSPFCQANFFSCAIAEFNEDSVEGF